MLKFKLTIYVPTSRNDGVQEKIDAITRKAGGCTQTLTAGHWVDGRGHMVSEPVMKYEWWHDGTGRVDTPAALLRAALLDAGEESVMWEELTPHTNHAIIFDR